MKTMAGLILAAVLLAAMAGQDADEVHKVGAGVTAPKLIRKREPQYTTRASEARIQGDVLVALEVSPKGLPENISIKKGLHPDLDANAIKAVKAWRFRPAMKAGKPVRAAATVVVQFRLL